MATVAVAAALASSAGAATNRAEHLLAPPRACPGSTRSAAPPDVQLHAMACLVEYVRERAGLPLLRVSTVLDRAARLKIEADVRCAQFSHTPCGTGFLTVFSRSGYTGGASAFFVGENLAWSVGARATPRQVMSLWLHSPEHLRNLLTPQWREFGLGVRPRLDFLGIRGATLWANEFGVRH